MIWITEVLSEGAMVGAALLVPLFLVYVAARVATAAYFASKMEYDKAQDQRLIDFQKNFISSSEKDRH